MLQAPAPTGLEAAAYNAQGLPRAMAITIAYRYNASGQRTYKKKEGDRPNWYIRDGASKVATVDEDELCSINSDGEEDCNFVKRVAWTILLPSGEAIGRQTSASGRRYYLKDHLGSIRAVLDGSGAVKETRDYYPFGLPLPSRYDKGSPPTKEDFTGYEKDSETQLHYAGARYYSAAFGRFTITDRFADKYPSLSPYQYAANNPASLIDVNGDTIWVENGEDRIPYTAGMDCEGCSDFASATVRHLNEIAGAEGGEEVVDALVKSEHHYNLLNKKPEKEEATMGFKTTENGAEISASAILDPERLNKGQRVFSLSSELFHGYQVENGQNAETPYSEVGSYLFGSVVQRRTTNTVPQLFVGAGEYKRAMESLYDEGFSMREYRRASKGFMPRRGDIYEGRISKYNPNKIPSDPLIKRFSPYAPQF